MEISICLSEFSDFVYVSTFYEMSERVHLIYIDTTNDFE
jgi:hypothetical protein